MKGHEIIRMVRSLCPQAKDCDWSEMPGMGYFKTTLDGKRRVVAVDLVPVYWPTTEARVAQLVVQELT